MNRAAISANRIGLGQPPVILHEPDVLEAFLRKPIYRYRDKTHFALTARRGGKQSLTDLTELAAISSALFVAGFAAIWAMSM